MKKILSTLSTFLFVSSIATSVFADGYRWNTRGRVSARGCFLRYPLARVYVLNLSPTPDWLKKLWNTPRGVPGTRMSVPLEHSTY